MEVHVGPRNYLIFRGIDPYKDFLEEPMQPWDLSFQGTEPVDALRKKLLRMKGLKEPVLVTVKGTLFHCALMSPGWWDRREKADMAKPRWNDPLQKWLFFGFDLWGPSWDFSWDFEDSEKEIDKPYFVAQLGDGDEADSLPILIPRDKGMKIRQEFQGSWGGLEVTVTGLLGHRSQFTQNPDSLGLVGGLLDYCIWLKEDDKDHKISLRCDDTDIYSGYLWKCVAPKKWLEEKKALSLNHVYFIWEHTNFTEKSAIDYNLDSLAHKESYIRKEHGDLVLLQRSCPMVPGRPEWSAKEFYALLVGKKGKDI